MTRVVFAATALIACSGPAPTSECAGDGDCPAGRYCPAGGGTCTRDCAIDEDCPSAERCSPRGRCEAPSDGGAPDAGAICVSDADCDDRVYCNGVELCRPGSAGASPLGCMPAPQPRCASGQACREEMRVCVSCEVGADGDGDLVRAIDCGGTDCDDEDANRFPGNPEVCDPTDFAHDEDCRPDTFGQRDVDGDGYTDARCTNSFDGVTQSGNDCNDDEYRSRPGLPENPCDGIDNDCNGAIDDAAATTYYRDRDADGYGAAADGTFDGCTPPAGYVDRDGDCQPLDERVNPGRAEVCDGIDDNCDGAGDEALGGVACPTGLPGRCAAGRTICRSGSSSPMCDPTSAPACAAGAVADCSVCSIPSGVQQCDGCDFGACALRNPTLTLGTFTAVGPGISHECGSAAGTAWISDVMTGRLALRGPALSVPAGVYEVEFLGANFGTATGPGGEPLTEDGYVMAFVDGVARATTAMRGGSGLAAASIAVAGAGCHTLELALPCRGETISTFMVRRAGD